MNKDLTEDTGCVLFTQTVNNKQYKFKIVRRIDKEVGIEYFDLYHNDKEGVLSEEDFTEVYIKTIYRLIFSNSEHCAGCSEPINEEEEENE